MAFDINSLDGVTFAAGTFSDIQITQTAGDVTYGNGVWSVASAGDPSASFTAQIDPSFSAQFKVISSQYTPANSANPAYTYPASFGIVEIYSVNSIGEHAGAPLYANVIGFNNGQLLLSGHSTSFDPASQQPFLYSNSANGAGFNYTQQGGVIFTYGFPPDYSTPDHFYNNSGAPAGLTFQLPPPCFAEGTRIATARGQVAVEDLVEGDEVITALGAMRPVIWIGSRNIRPRHYANANEVNPVRIRAGAFAEGVPSRDLMLSPGHAVFVDGALVPASHLVNGATIVQEAVEQVRYFHVELDAHDVLLAEGLPSESYLDDGNREVFGNAPEHIALYGRLDPVDWEGACAPVLRDWSKDGEAIAAIRTRLHARALEMGWHVNSDADLAILADGVRIEPLHQAGNRFWFQLPKASAVKLVSSTGRPFDLIPGNLDTRNLGVAIRDLRVNGEPIDLSGDMFGEGFYGPERHGDVAWRWTNGEAVLGVEGPVLIEVALQMSAQSWTRPAARLRLVAVS